MSRIKYVIDIIEIINARSKWLGFKWEYVEVGWKWP